MTTPIENGSELQIDAAAIGRQSVEAGTDGGFLPCAAGRDLQRSNTPMQYICVREYR